MGGQDGNKSAVPRVLVIDDSQGVRTLLTNVLPLLGFEIVGAASGGPQGVTMAANTQPDLIVLDMQMPQPDGLETIGLLQKEVPDTKIVMFSSDDGRDLPARALGAGADVYLDKLTPVDELADAMHRVVLSDGSAPS